MILSKRRQVRAVRARTLRRPKRRFRRILACLPCRQDCARPCAGAWAALPGLRMPPGPAERGACTRAWVGSPDPLMAESVVSEAEAAARRRNGREG